MTRFFAVCVVLVALCAATVFGTAYVISASFIEVRDDRPNASVTGTLYYYYDSSNYQNSRLRLEYNLPGSVFINNLYNYYQGVMYSMCESGCTAHRISEIADPWYSDSNYYEARDSEGFRARTQYMPSNAPATYHPQLKHIWVGNDNVPSTSIRYLYFNDGRKLSLSQVTQLDPSEYSPTNNLFTPSSDCPSSSGLNVYADIVVLLDNSGAVTDNNWGKMVEFTTELLQSFNINERSAEAAVVSFTTPSFASPDTTSSFCDKDQECQRCTRDAYFTTDELFQTNTASVIAGENNGLSYSGSSLQALLANARQLRPSYGVGRCQAFGLEVAMSIFQNSHRNNANRIVIALSANADYCPNSTSVEAGRLKNEYRATLIEIGIELQDICDNYDRRFLENASSMINGNPLFLEAEYQSLYTKIPGVLSMIGDDFQTSECGSECEGFCGCGQCFCPDCDNDPFSCFINTCKVNNGFSRGCVPDDDLCENVGTVDNVCTFHKCNQENEEKCTIVENDCSEVREMYKGTCRRVFCSAAANGCAVHLDDEWCQNEFGEGACVTYECTPLNEAVPAGYEESGCRVKSNKTADCMETYVANGMAACFIPSCDSQTGQCNPIDICPSGTVNENCYSYSCQKANNNQYECMTKEINRPVDTKCTKYECQNNGWVGRSIMNASSCKEHFRQLGYDVTCKGFTCDDNSGCTILSRPICDAQCTETKMEECNGEGQRRSRVDQCIAGRCEEEKHGDEVELVCAFSEAINCIDSMKAVIDNLNGNASQSGICYSASCENGICQPVGQSVPKEYEKHRCMEPKCEEQADGTWKWVYAATEEKQECHDDECMTRYCDENHGCVNNESLCVQTVVVLGFSAEFNLQTFNKTELLETISTQCGVSVEVLTIGFETDEDGNIIRVLVYVDEEETAIIIADKLNALNEADACVDAGILCQVETVKVAQTGLTLSGTYKRHETSLNVMLILFVVCMILSRNH